MDRRALLEDIRLGKARVDEALAAVPGDRMDEPGPGGTWSPTDQLSHLAAWHQVVAARIRTGREEDLLELPPGYADMGIDAVNEFFARRDAGRTASEARDAFERTYLEVVAALEGLDDADLHRPFREELPGRTLEETIRGNTTEHYEEHLPMLRALAGPR